jgi:hypothetical protein
MYGFHCVHFTETHKYWRDFCGYFLCEMLCSSNKNVLKNANVAIKARNGRMPYRAFHNVLHDYKHL